MLSFDTEMMTSQGGRPDNQDRCNFLIRKGVGCWLVADGLGGHGGGGEAAALVADSILERFAARPEVEPTLLAEHFRAANDLLLGAQAESPQLKGMASTAVALLAGDGKAVWAHVGDSRLYHFRDGTLAHRTRDHSVAQALLDAGDITPADLPKHPDRSALRRSLGRTENHRPTVLENVLDLQAGDAFLLCSDGFWELLPDVEMEIDLAGSARPAEWLERMVVRVAERASEGHDNYSAVAVFVDAEPQPASGGAS